MKKFLVFAGLIGVSPLIYAAQPEQPWLIYPQSGATLPTNLPAFFTWENTKGSGITNYRLVISTDAAFSGYNQKTKSCTNKTTCFTDKTAKKSYVLRQTTGSILKNDTNYYWFVEAMTASDTSVFDTREFAYGAPATPIDTPFTVIAPNITGVSTDIPSVVSGSPIVISAVLDGALPTGYSVKVDYGNGLIPMNTSATGADYSATPTKSATYSVGIYDDKNILKSNKLTGKFEVTAATTGTGGSTATGNAPVLTLVSDATAIATAKQGVAYTVQLSATDADANLKQIVMDWGDGSSDTVNVDDGVTRSLTHIYSSAAPFTWTATVYDSTNLASNAITQAVTVSAPVVTDPTTPPVVVPPKAPSYSAINDSGNPTNSSVDWRCTLDSTTNLMWEAKTNDNNLHDKDWTYSWFEPDTTKNGGYQGGSENGGRCNGVVKCNTDVFIKAVNAEKLCGKENWRLPTKQELEKLVVCPNGETPNRSANATSDICLETNPPLDPYNPRPSIPFVDTVYFPNTKTDWYWTSDTYIPTISSTAKPLTSKQKKPVYDSAWNVSFYDGHVRADNKVNAAHVRLVSDGASATPKTSP